MSLPSDRTYFLSITKTRLGE